MNASSHHLRVTSMLCVLIQSDHTHVDATKAFRDREEEDIAKVRAVGDLSVEYCVCCCGCCCYYYCHYYFFEILSDLNQVVPNHLADERSQTL